MECSWMRVIGWAAALLGAAGCGPMVGDDGGGSGSATSGASSAADTSGGADASSTRGDGTTGITTTGITTTGITTLGDETSGTGMDETGGTETGEEACPPPERILADFTVTPDEDIDEVCVVLAVNDGPGMRAIDLDCGGAQDVTLTVSTSPPMANPNVGVGGPVRLRYATDPIFWINRWVALASASGESDWLLMAGVSGSALDPPGTTLEDFLGGGIGAPTITEVAGLCEPFDDDCGPVERLALDFVFADGPEVRVFDQGSGFFDILAYGWSFAVQSAVSHPRSGNCDDVPPAWYQFVMVWFPSD